MRRFAPLPLLLALTLISSAALAESLLDAPAGLEPTDPPPASRSGRLVPVPDVPAARDVEPGPDLRDRNGDGVADSLAERLQGAPANQRFDVIAAFTTPARAAAARRALGPVDLRHEYDLIPGFAASLTAGQVNALTRMPGVVRVEEVAPVHAFLEAERRDFGADTAQLGVASGGSGVDGSGVGICIVDTGVFAAQEQLDSKDITFVDFVGTSLEPYDDQGHGTHVASIAAGDGTAPDGGDQAGAALYRGVAPGASLYAAKVLNSAGEGTTDDVIAGVEWCADQSGVRVMNLSLGEVGSSDGSDLLSQAVDAAVSEGVVVVVAAGNSGAGPYTISSPAAAPLAITVGAVAEWSTSTEAVGESDGIYIAPFSSRGPTADNRIKPDIVAPGVSIIAGYIDPTGSGAFGCTTDCYTSLSGTSMAAPFTAGVAALMLQADPTLTPAQVKTLLAETATHRGPDLGGGQNHHWGHGLLDAAAAVAAAAWGVADTPTAFPTYAIGSGQVTGSTPAQVPIPVDDPDVPLAVTVLILDGGPQLFCDIFLGCVYEWRPDFDVRLRDPNGNIVAEGFCMLGSLYGFECGNVGRQETVHIPSPLLGTYTLEVYKGTSDSANGSFRYEVSRGPLVGSTSSPANEPPVANIDNTTTPYETPVTIHVLANDVDDDGPDPLSVVEITQPANGTAVLNQDQTITFTPDAGFFGLTGFDYSITDGVDVSDLASVAVTVEEPVNQPPVAVDDAATTDQGVALQIDVLANDRDPNGDTLSIASVTPASRGTVSSTDAFVTYEPEADFVGTDTFTYTVRDGQGGTDSASVTVTVNEVTTPPPPLATVHVGDLDGTSTNNGKTWSATVSVEVHQSGGHAAVAGATVSGIWSPGGNATCTSGTNGRCQVVLGDNAKKQGSVTFAVTGVSSTVGAYVGDDNNHDTDGDSVNGTLITVAKP